MQNAAQRYEWTTYPSQADKAMVEPRWYAAYTRANHEKHVAAHLGSRGVEHFLPVYCSTRRWKDRRVQLELPLFPGYVFVRLALFDRLRVIEIPGVVRLVGFGGGLATALPDDQVEALRSGLNGQVRALPHPFLCVGRRVRIKSGPLAGLEGILVRRKGRNRVVVSIEMIQRSISVDADATDVEPNLFHVPVGLLSLNSSQYNQ